MITINKISQNIAFKAIQENTKDRILGLNLYDRNEKESVNLPDILCYRPVFASDYIAEGKKLISEFKSLYGTPKSSTLLAQIIKQEKRKGTKEDILEGLMDKRFEFMIKVKAQRHYMGMECYNDDREYLDTLENYVTKNGCYLNCNECADIVWDLANAKKLNPKNINIYSVNERNEQIAKANHVFSVVGMDEDADIENPKTWGQNAVVVDVWADICMRAQDAIEYYREFFLLSENQDFKFQSCPVSKSYKRDE